MAALDFPASPTDGQVYGSWIYSTSKGAWKAKPLTPGQAQISATAPANPNSGDQWYNSNDGVLYIYYNDGNTSQWVESRSAITSDGYYSPNYIINGDFGINQRAFASTTASGTYGLDRWLMAASGGCTYSVQAMTPGSITGASESGNYARLVTTGQSGTSVNSLLIQKIEDVRRLTGTVTVSFWARAASGNPKVAVEMYTDYGIGGSPSSAVTTYAGQVTLSTAWTRYSVTTVMPSLSGKTVGTTANTSYNGLQLWVSAGTDFNARTGSIGIQSNTFDFFGVQVEEGPVATPFRRNANSLQGELAACQRYFYTLNNNKAQSQNFYYGVGAMYQALQGIAVIHLPVEMRAIPSLSTSAASTFQALTSSSNLGITTIGLSVFSLNTIGLAITTASSISNAAAFTLAGYNAASYIWLNAEL